MKALLQHATAILFVLLVFTIGFTAGLHVANDFAAAGAVFRAEAATRQAN